MFSNPWILGIALLVAGGLIALALKMIFSCVINKETGPSGLDGGSTE